MFSYFFNWIKKREKIYLFQLQNTNFYQNKKIIVKTEIIFSFGFYFIKKILSFVTNIFQ